MNILKIIKDLRCNHDFIKVGQSEFHTVNYGNSELNKHRHVYIRCRKCCKQITYIEDCREDYLWNEGK